MNAEERESNHPEGAGQPEEDADWNAQLFKAAERGDLEVVDSLLNSRDIDINREDKDSKLTALKVASREGHLEVVRVLLKHPRIRIREDTYETTALHLAIVNGHLEIVNVLLENSWKGSFNWPKYDSDSEEEEDENLRDLSRWDRFLLVNAPDHDECTPLHLAVQYNHLEIVKVLLDQPGIEANAPRLDGGYTPLGLAIVKGHEEVVEVLLESCEVNIREIGVNEEEKNSMHLAAERGHLGVVKALLVSDISYIVDTKCRGGCTPLHLAAQEGHAEVVKELIENNHSNLDHKDDAGQTALDVAREKGHISCIEILTNVE